MMLGGRVAAPVGMVSFCQRFADECGAAAPKALTAAEAPPVVVPVALVKADPAAPAQAEPAGMLNWASKTEAATFAPASAVIRPSQGRRATDWSALFAVARAEQAPPPAAAPVAVRPSVEPGGGLPMSDRLWKTLNDVNTTVNRDIVHREDTETYGMGDFWSLPAANGKGYGDCEDYVLEKRRRLVAAGVSPEALSIALVVTSYGESHAVLVVDTDKGDFVLDNLTPWINAWSTTGYRWVARQAPGGDPMNWVSLAGASS